MINHKSTRYQVRKKTLSDGKVVFEHEDRETTEILNYLSGKGVLSRKMKIKIVAREVSNYLLLVGEKTPGDLETNEAKLKEKCLALYWCLGVVKQAQPGQKSASDWLDNVASPRMADEDLYQSIWLIEGIAGNPKLRWTTSFERHAPESVGYYSSRNTIYIDPPSVYGLPDFWQFVSEAAHGKQYHKKPMRSEWLSKRDHLRMWAAALMAGSDYGKIYDCVLYDKPGTLEYEAHKIIEPELQKMVKTAPAN